MGTICTGQGICHVQYLVTTNGNPSSLQMLIKNNNNNNYYEDTFTKGIVLRTKSDFEFCGHAAVMKLTLIIHINI